MEKLSKNQEFIKRKEKIVDLGQKIMIGTMLTDIYFIIEREKNGRTNVPEIDPLSDTFEYMLRELYDFLLFSKLSDKEKIYILIKAIYEILP